MIFILSFPPFAAIVTALTKECTDLFVVVVVLTGEGVTPIFVNVVVLVHILNACLVGHCIWHIGQCWG